MQKFTTLHAVVAPLDRANVDTDAIIPKQFLSSVERTGFGQFLFDEWRYLDHGELGMDVSKRPLNPEFVLNQACYQEAKILLGRANFGCGSSREHAPWALYEHGFRVIIAPSFADIFFNNCIKNGLLCIVLSEATIDELFKQTYATKGFSLHVDLDNQQLKHADGTVISFTIAEHHKHRLQHGLDEIALTLQHQDEIKAYEQKMQARSPWLFSTS